MTWNPTLHDPILTALHKAGHTDLAVTSIMCDMGCGICAQDVAAARRRLCLAPNKKARVVSHDHGPAMREKSNPISDAKHWLGKRLVEKDGVYYLDGSPAKLVSVMRAYNRMRKAMGAEQEDRNPAWVVPV